jgi:hypothetical protein
MRVTPVNENLPEYEVCRIRGATLNAPSALQVNHERMRQLVCNFVEHQEVGQEKLTYDHTRRLMAGPAVISELAEKIYKPTMRKGRVLAGELPPDAPTELRYSVVPWGYKCE